MMFAGKSGAVSFGARLALTLLGSAWTAFPATAQTAAETDHQRFVRAIEDASVAEPSEIYAGLVAIRPDNATLVREGDSPGSRIRVVSWMSEETFQRYWAEPAGLPADKAAPNTWNVQIWATTVPEVRELCRRIDGDVAAVTARVKQFLGLDPTRGYARFVEFWVAPDDLLRPCPDSETDDSVCGLDLPDGTATDYRAWFTGNYYYAYSVKGAPWTRLGYTYDWAAAADVLNPHRPVGASEFILRPGAPYSIAARYTTAEYCGK